MKRILSSLVIAACLAAGCVNDTFTENKFMEATAEKGSEIALIERGARILSYNHDTWQLGFNDTRKEFRVHDDKMGYYYVLKCSVMPVEEGQVVEARLEWTTYNDSKSRNMTFTVLKIDSDRRIWLWNAKNQIGVVVVALQ